MKEVVQTTKYKCDLCHRPCDISDRNVEVVMGLIGGELPITVNSTLSVYVPYGNPNGDICNPCKLKALEKYVLELKRQLEKT